MDKYTYSLKAEKIQKLVRQEDYLEAARIADTVDWKQEHNVRLLSAVSEAYEKIGEYDKAIDVLLTAYERTSLGKRHIYKLTELALAAGHVEDAEAFYRRYLEEAPDENNRYILRYKIAEAKGESLDKRIAILETYKKYEFEEEWACRLAELYNEAGMEKQCVALCDEIILWFGVGSYVDRAMELKEIWQPLTDAQREHRENREYYAARVKAVANEMSEAAEEDEEEPLNTEEETDIPEEDLSAEEDLPVIAISPEVAGSDIEKTVQPAAEEAVEAPAAEEPAAAAVEAPAPEEPAPVPEEIQDPDLEVVPEDDVRIYTGPSRAVKYEPAREYVDPAAPEEAASVQETVPEPVPAAVPAEPEVTETAVPQEEEDPFDISSYEDKTDEPDFYTADNTAFEEPKLDTEITPEEKQALADRTDPAAVRDGQDEMERTRNLKDILRSTIGSPRRVRENLEPTREFRIPRELLGEEETAEAAATAATATAVTATAAAAAAGVAAETEVSSPAAAPEEKAAAEPAAVEPAAVEPAAEAVPADAAEEQPAAAEKKEEAQPAPEIKAEEQPADPREDEMLYKEDEILYEDNTVEEAEPAVQEAAPEVKAPVQEEPLDSPFDTDGPAAGGQIPLSADEGVLPVLSFEETERAVWEDQSRRRKETDPLKNKGMERCIFVPVEEGEDSVDAAIDAMEEYYTSRGRELPPIARILSEKLNNRGLVKSIPQLTGKDLIIDRASGLSDDMIKELLRVIEHLDTGKVFALTDSASGIEIAKQRIRQQIIANANALGRDHAEDAQAKENFEAVPDRRPQRRVRKVQPLNFERIHPDHELSEKDFIRYADFFAHKIECVLDDSAIDALEDEVDLILREGGRLTPSEAEDIIEDAAEHASRKMFGKKYDKDGFLILREKNFD